MSGGIIEIVRRVVEQEMARRRDSLLGVVSAVFPNEDGKGYNNYEVSVRLKHEDLELQKVPLAVAHIGFVAPPRPGELVLVQFINGDLNQPVITGRFYTDEALAPLFKEDEILVEHRPGNGDRLNHFRFKADGTILLQRDVEKPEDNSRAKTSIKIDGETNALEIKVEDKVTVTLKKDAIEITADGKPITVTCDTMTVKGNVTVEKELVVGTGPKTTIKGNEITGG